MEFFESLQVLWEKLEGSLIIPALTLLAPLTQLSEWEPRQWAIVSVSAAHGTSATFSSEDTGQ